MASRTLQMALWPISVVYGGAARLRVALYRSGILRSRRLKGTVISVGNLTVGGTGKTPMVMWLAERLAAEGHRPAILTRGYLGENQAGGDGLPSSDEVSLLRERLGAHAQLGVGKDRYASGQTLARHGVEWFLLDDGFQHLKLQRDANIVLVDSTDAFGGGMVLPAGRMREPRSALGRADVVVITRSDRAPAVETLVRRHTQAPIFYARNRLEAVLRAPGLDVDLPEGMRADAKFFAFCGIGNPRAFFEDAQLWGFSLAGKRSFRDHHRYSRADAARLENDARAAGADALLCTEKDVFNLRDAMPAQMPVYACRIRLAVANPDAFWNAIMKTVRRHGAAGEAKNQLAAEIPERKKTAGRR